MRKSIWGSNALGSCGVAFLELQTVHSCTDLVRAFIVCLFNPPDWAVTPTSSSSSSSRATFTFRCFRNCFLVVVPLPRRRLLLLTANKRVRGAALSRPTDEMTFADFFVSLRYVSWSSSDNGHYSFCLLPAAAAAAALQNGTLAILGRAHTLSHSGLEQKNTQSHSGKMVVDTTDTRRNYTRILHGFTFF